MELKSFPLSSLSTAAPVARTAGDDLLLERSIGARGIRFPVVVRPLADRLFKVIDGERRITIARRLHERGRLKAEFLSIPCLTVTIETPMEEAMWRLICNLHTNLTPDAAEGLATTAGMKAFKLPAQAKADDQDDAVVKITNLIQGLAERRHQIRSSKRTLDAFDIARNYLAEFATFQESMDALRFSSCDD